ncbi:MULTISPECIES: hypothetical protein [Lentilactobacillus]|uniref:Uncharacterized protein n=1 Tax=Lentilactobacillus parafarraginis F0439 TaxID=797515 RepID=G9ZRP4_9LACO|nr:MULTISPECIES: hypothetical protein [Lentilactobacillus]EHL96262.1 hypothetical protein HMPREF9103_02405 [Lentilactobacillus parafarraginis F0439]MCV3742405.1 hypothetical protein [Lentilactobacillus hilgardii]MQN23434.1 hypothetical protein [Lentilactobacillus buchneri]
MDKLNMNLSVHSLDELKELLPQIATLAKNYEINLNVNLMPSDDQMAILKAIKRNTEPLTSEGSTSINHQN